MLAALAIPAAVACGLGATAVTAELAGVLRTARADPLTGGRGRIFGTVIGTVILGLMMSGFTFLRVDAYYQEIVKGIIIVAAVVADVYRQKARSKKA